MLWVYGATVVGGILLALVSIHKFLLALEGEPSQGEAV